MKGLSAILVCICPLSVLGAPIVLSDSDDDATLTLSIEDQVELGTTGWASVRIQIGEEDVPLTVGDAVSLELLDSDGGASDDLLFSTSFFVTALDVAAGFIDRTIDAIFDAIPFLPDGSNDNTLEVYARALVDKDACGVFCVNDQPETSAASVTFFDSAPPPPDGITVLRDSDDDATLTLSTFDEMLVGSTEMPSVRIQVVGDDVPLTLGDSVLIELFDQDDAGDDLLFSTFFDVTPGEVLASLVDRTFEAIFDPSAFLPDGSGDDTLELYAQALIEKDACGVFCVNDQPRTAVAPVAFVVPATTPVPEPGSLTLLIAGLAGVAFASRKRVYSRY